MCGRFVSSSSADDLAGWFAVDDVRLDADDAPRWNVAPTDPVRVVVQRESVRTLETRRWGLVPHWERSADGAARRINARAETVHELPAFRDAFARSRCIVAADGFYEWKRRPDAPPKPFYIRAVDGSPLAFAGLRATWGAPGESPLRTATIVTTDANTALDGLHDRMPVVLPRDAWDQWLDPAERDAGLLRAMLVPAPDTLLEVVPVGIAVNSVRNQGPGLIERVADAVQTELF